MLFAHFFYFHVFFKRSLEEEANALISVSGMPGCQRVHAAASLCQAC